MQSILTILLFLAASSAYAFSEGDQVDYRRGETFHVELLAFQPNGISEKFRNERAGKRYPISYGYPVADAVMKGEVQPAPSGTVDVEVIGLRPDMVASALLLRADRKQHNRFVKEIVPSARSGNSVTFTGVPVGGTVGYSIVLPYAAFDPTQEHLTKITARSFRIGGPFAAGNTLFAPMDHRTKANPDRINVGMVIPIEVVQ